MLNLLNSETWTLDAAINDAVSVLKYSRIYLHQRNMISGMMFAPSCISVHPV